MNTWLYVTSPTGTVHLTKYFNHHGPTLCGLESYSRDRNRVLYWPQGDETASGIAATCKMCKKLAEKNQGA